MICDIAFCAARSLGLEGGPPRQNILTDAGHLASYVTGVFGARVQMLTGAPPYTQVGSHEFIQNAHLDAGLQWTIQELGLH